MSVLELVFRGKDEGASSLVKRIKDDTSDLDKNTKSLSDRFKDTGGAVDAATGPFALLTGAAIKTGSEFQGVINRIEAVGGEDATRAIDQITAKALQLGKDLPLSAKQAADGMFELVAAGFEVDEMLAASEGVAQLAASQQMEVGRAAEITAATLRGFGYEAKRTGEVVDLLSQIANASAAGIEDIGETIKYVGPVAGATGQELKEMAVAIGLMANVGIKGSQAGTSLRTTLTNLVKPSNEAGDAMRKLGIQVTDNSAQVAKSVKEMDKEFAAWKKTTTGDAQNRQIHEAMKELGITLPLVGGKVMSTTDAMKHLQREMNSDRFSIEEKNKALAALGLSYTKTGGDMLPFMDIIKQFRTNMGGMSEDQKANLAATIAGKEAMSGFLALVNASDEDFNGMIASMGEAEGATEKFSEKMNKGLGFQMNQLSGSLETLMISVFLKLDPILSGLTEKVTGVVNAVIGWVEQNPVLAGNLGLVIAGLGILGPLIGGLIMAIGLLMSPITLIVGGIALLAFAWLNNFMGIRDATDQLWLFLQPIFQMAADWLGVQLPLASQSLSDFWNNTLYPALEKVGKFIDDPLKPFFVALAKVGLAGVEKGGEAVANVWERYLKPALESIGQIIYEKAGPALEWLNINVLTPLQKTFDGVGQAIRDATGWLSDLAGKISNFQLPDWLQRHSPAPIEQTFSGWAAGIRDVRDELGSLNVPGLPGVGGIGGQPLLAPALAGGSPIHVTVNARIYSQVDEEMLGHRIATIIDKRLRGR